jgi:putative transposase
MTTRSDRRYRRHRFPPEVISMAVWMYFRFPLSLRMVEEMLAARGISVSHETVRRWAEKFGRDYANRLRRRAIRPGDTWHLDEVVITIAGEKHWLWRAVDGHGFVLDVLVQKRRDTKAAKRLMRKLFKKYAMAPRVMITDKLRSYAAAKWELRCGAEHRQHKGLNNRAENSHQPTRRRERIMKRFKSAQACSEISLHPRSDRQPVSSSPGSTVCKWKASCTNRSVDRLEQRDRRGAFSMTFDHDPQFGINPSNLMWRCRYNSSLRKIAFLGPAFAQLDDTRLRHPCWSDHREIGPKRGCPPLSP